MGGQSSLCRPFASGRDAVVVDTTNMDFAQSKDAILQVIRRRTQP